MLTFFFKEFFCDWDHYQDLARWPVLPRAQAKEGARRETRTRTLMTSKQRRVCF
jgi:hypothetical protein